MVIPVTTQPITLTEFKTNVERPENAGRLFELINGEMVEVSPGRASYSRIHELLSFAVQLYCRDQNLPCYTASADGAFSVSGRVVAPDFAYSQTPFTDEYPELEPPLWAVEIVSPTDKPHEIRDKRTAYIEAGILYWEVYRPLHSVDVYEPGKPLRILRIDDVLDGGAVLPGFRMTVRDLFRD